jgi:hypothetical protein
VKMGVAPLAKELPDVLKLEALNRDLLELEQGRLRWIAVDRHNLLGTMHNLQGMLGSQGEFGVGCLTWFQGLCQGEEH